MKEEELRQCQIHEWYPLFKPYSIRTLFHPLSDDFVRYILGDPHSSGDSPPPFLLPISFSGTDPLPRVPDSSLDPISILDPDTSPFLVDLDSDTDLDGFPPSFPTLELAVSQSISSLGGAVFPKLNWSSPKDAAWISPNGSLRCTSFAEISLLLHSSDRVAHDLSHASSSCSDRVPSSPPFTFFLALRKFFPGLRPEMEFRCFVRRRRLVGISQREVTAFYPSLVQRRWELSRVIEDFFDEVVCPSFGLEDYTFDVYVRGDGRVKVLDFNPWGGFTLPLLFTWEELEMEGLGEEEEEEEQVIFRVVDSQCGVRPGLKTAVPYDYLDTGEGSAWDEFLRKANDELRMQMEDIVIGK